jgi:hypothetical protein
MSDIKNWNLSEIGMVFDPQTGESFQLNASAYFIISLLKQGQTTEEITSALATKFKISYEEALTDVLAFQVEMKVIKGS